MSIPSKATQQLHEAIKSVNDVIEAGRMYAVEEAADDLMLTLDEGGYDVKVETMEELINDVEKLMASGDLDEGLLGKLKSKVIRAKKSLAAAFMSPSHETRRSRIFDAGERKGMRELTKRANQAYADQQKKGPPKSEKERADYADLEARVKRLNARKPEPKPTEVIAAKKAAAASAKSS